MVPYRSLAQKHSDVAILARALLLAAVIATSLGGTANAQWPANGRAYTGGSAVSGSAVSDGAGHIVSGFAKIDTTGATLWSLSPIPSVLKMAPDGAGGALVLYNSGSSPYAARVGTSGTLLWSGSRLSTSNFSQNIVVGFAADAAGNGFAIWRTSDNRLFAGKVSSAGSIQWGASGVLVSDAVNTALVLRPTVVADESGGCYLLWDDWRAGTSLGPTDVYMQHILSAGTVAWTANGLPLSSGPGFQFRVDACTDGSGGFIAAWRDNRSGDYDVYVQRVDGSGTSQWTAGGVRLFTDPGGNPQDQLDPAIVADGVGGAFIAWADYRNAGFNNGSDIYAQKIDASGSSQWTAGGVAVATTTNAETSPRVALDGAGGILVGWSSPGGVVQHLTGAGSPLWTANGVKPIISTAQTDDIVPDGVGGCYFGTGGFLGRVFPNGMPAWGRDYQAVATVSDVTGDEGGWVDLSFNTPAPDGNPAYGSYTLTAYSVWRKRPGSSAAAGVARLEDPTGILAGLASVPSVGSFMTAYTDFPPGTWDIVSYLPRLAVPSYSFLVPTHTDSTSNGPGNDDFAVMSISTSPVFVVSLAATGHSVDNLAPGPPQNLTGGKTGPTSVLLQWSPGPESDLWHYAIYRGDSPSFSPSPTNRIGQPTAASFQDDANQPGVSYYKISAIDRHENESGFALLTPSQIVSVPPGAMPARTYLAPAVPNPFRSATALEYGIAHRSYVSIDLYDPSGRRVKRLVGEVRDPGVYRAVWDGGDEGRHPMPAGVYLVRLEADGLRKNLKVVRAE
jgi:hypothetical protein